MKKWQGSSKWSRLYGFESSEVIPVIKHQIVIFAALSLGFFFVVSACAQQAAPPAALTNVDILKIVDARLNDAVIVSLIKSSRSKFDTSPDAIIKLKAGGVSDAVIGAMVESARTSQPVASATSQLVTSAASFNPNDPRSPHAAGIYWFGQGQRDSEPHLIELEPTLYQANLHGGMFKSAITYGIAKSNMKAVVHGGKANLRINEPSPEFWFYFDEKSAFAASSGLSGASSPNEFVLAKVEAKSDARELVIGEMGTYGTSTGTRPKDTVEFRFDKIAPGIYRATPLNPLKPGEYCFFEADTNFAVGQNSGKLFDFGINPGL